MTKNISKRNILKSRLSAAYAKISDAETRRETLAEYEILCGQFDLSDRMLAKHLLRSILPAVAFYRVLPRKGFTRADALALIRSSVLRSGQPMAKTFQTMGRLPFFFSLLRVMCPVSVKSEFGASGWKMDWKENSRHRIAFDAHSCFYERVFKDFGMPELTPVFCELDDVIYGNIPKVRWKRTKTIGSGNDVCDFCFENERRHNFRDKKEKATC
ncbi:MAG: L-2-amino-thiazoline-4-carboxylic acid hydrolase [Prevotellaceae bacterium]|jgi:hypothetical protein|nr:L-2-amino-thiazoline-4-carboxylic acid hydrolase [Prevotellaceae bacterium]